MDKDLQKDVAEAQRRLYRPTEQEQAQQEAACLEADQPQQIRTMGAIAQQLRSAFTRSLGKDIRTRKVAEELDRLSPLTVLTEPVAQPGAPFTKPFDFVMSPIELEGGQGVRFVEMLRDLAMTLDRHGEIARKWEVLEDWLGCRGRQLSQCDRDKVKRAWLSYKAGGVAPTAELQEAFQCSAKWLRLSGVEQLYVPPDVIRVFGEMLGGGTSKLVAPVPIPEANVRTVVRGQSPHDAQDIRLQVCSQGMLARFRAWSRNVVDEFSEWRNPAMSDEIPPLMFKDGPSAFEHACKYMDCPLGPGVCLPAIVLDAREMLGAATSVQMLEDGNQIAMLKVASDDGGFAVFAATQGPKGPRLSPGNLVVWKAGQHSPEVAVAMGAKDARSGWIGLITGTLKPAHRNGQWMGDARFSSS